MTEAPPGSNWEFDGFTMLPEMRLLLRDGVAIPLTPKAFDTLAILITNRDRVVTKDELLRSVWPDVVVEEGNLTQQIFLLRKALGETAQQSRYIVTVPGRGYRFTARVKAISGGAPSPPAALIGRGRSVGMGYVAIGAVVLLAIVLGVVWRARNGQPMDLAKARVDKITESGKAIRSAASADGRYVAYVEDHGDQHSLWVRTAGGGRTEVVPREPSVLSSVTFSPDGEYLYFTRQRRVHGRFDLSRIPSTGGVESPVLDDVDTPISFSPDGSEFAFVRGTESGSVVMIAPTGGGTQRILPVSDGSVTIGLVGPDWSPDGNTLAAAAYEPRRTGPRRSIMLLPIHGGPAVKLHPTDSRIGQIRWLPDGKSLLTVLSEALTRQFPPWQGQHFQFSGGPIWRIYTDRRAPEQLTSDLIDHDPCCLHLARNGTEITSVNNFLVSDLWVAPADNLDARKQISWDKPTLTRHAWLPDNETMVYRDLGGDLKTAHREEGRQVNLSLPVGLKVAGGVSACGAGPYIVFAAVPGNHIWRVAANAAGAFELTRGSFDSNPACSPDGKWVMSSSSEPGNISVRRVSIEGGDARQLGPKDSFDALPSPDGRLMYYSASHWDEHGTRSALWVVRSITDPRPLFQVPMPDDISYGVPPAWAPDSNGLDYVVTTMGVSNIWRQRLADVPPEQVTQFNAGKIFSFAWSPDGKWLSFAGGANRSDVVTLSR